MFNWGETKIVASDDYVSFQSVEKKYAALRKERGTYILYLSLYGKAVLIPAKGCRGLDIGVIELLKP